ncbi:MAG: hypothetical protein MUO62_07735 [Anaerolineales bacterium]|nr:hypothetical protein [Anaerolineales bacterium]
MHLKSILIFTLFTFLAACTPAPQPEPFEDQVAAIVAATLTAMPAEDLPADPQPSATQAPEADPIQEAETLYRDETLGFVFSYPKDWSTLEIQTGQRASIVAFASWPLSLENLDETPPGETRLDLTVSVWEPLDLRAFIDQRVLAWEASGITVIKETTLALDGGLAAQTFRVAGADGAESYFYFTLIRDRFITLSGSGDFETLEQIGRSLQPGAD